MKPDYKNWVPNGMIAGMFVGAAVALALFLLFGVFAVQGEFLRVILGIVFGIAFLIFFVSGIYCVI